MDSILSIGAKVFINICTIPTVGSTVCIAKPTYFSKKRARERKRGERGETKRQHPRNSSRRINVGISTNIEFWGQKFVDKRVLLFRKHCNFRPIYHDYLT